MKKDARIDRRSFIKGVALSGATVGTLGLLSACSSPGNTDSSSSNNLSWDKEVGFLVVGSGTGAFAALAAMDLGAESVCVLEKNKTWGGTSAMSGGGFGIPLTDLIADAGVTDSKEEVIKYYKNATEDRVDEAVLGAFIDNGNDFLNWTIDTFGWKWTPSTVFGGDYYEPLPGWVPFGRSGFGASDSSGPLSAAQMWAQVSDRLTEGGVEILLGAEATSLITNEEGAVIGAKARVSNKEIAIRADNVVMATGGFDHDTEMRLKHLPHKVLTSVSCSTNTGDGHKMGQAVGADLSLMDCFFGVPAILTSNQDPKELIASNELASSAEGLDWIMYRSAPGAIVVNKKGQRIGDEAAAYDPFSKAFAAYDTGVMEHINIPAYFICDSACWNTYSFPGHIVQGNDNGYFSASGEVGAETPSYYFQADTIEELAKKLGIDADGLTQEIERFNENAAKGADPVFHRGEKEFDKNTAAVLAGNRDDLANPCLAPVATPPFYGAIYVPGTYGTSGGLTVNENTQVVTPLGEPIPGLYAIGTCSSGVSGGKYVHGIGLSSGSVMGWIAAHHALGL